MGVFNLATGTYSQLQPTLDGQPVQYGHPGDIKVGPDGNLYLLNNGAGDDAMLEMKPNGTVIKRIALNSKSPVAAGLQFGLDGKMYVADVVGGVIWKYDLNGGDPIAQLYRQDARPSITCWERSSPRTARYSPPKAPTARCRR